MQLAGKDGRQYFLSGYYCKQGKERSELLNKCDLYLPLTPQSAGHGKTKRNRRTGFKPPIKKTDVLPTNTDLSSAKHSQHSVTERGREREGGGQAKRRKQNDTQDDGDRACHTVLSYCEEENVDNGLDADTQPLSMFSGERREEEIGELDDLLFQPGDLFSRTDDDTLSKLDDRGFMLDDPLSKLDDPFSLSSDPPSLAQEEIGSVSEQVVPSGQSEQDEEDVRKEVEDDNMETDSEGDENKGEETRKLSFPRRQFKVAQSTRCYNLELLPKHYQKGTRKSSMSSRCGRERGSDSRAVPGRPAVNWATSVSVLVGRAGKEGSREDSGEQRTLSVYEVPLSAGDLRERGREGRVAESVGSCRGSKAVLSMSKLDLSLSCRSREEQVMGNRCIHNVQVTYRCIHNDLKQAMGIIYYELSGNTDSVYFTAGD